MVPKKTGNARRGLVIKEAGVGLDGVSGDGRQKRITACGKERTWCPAQARQTAKQGTKAARENARGFLGLQQVYLVVLKRNEIDGGRKDPRCAFVQLRPSIVGERRDNVDSRVRRRRLSNGGKERAKRQNWSSIPESQGRVGGKDYRIQGNVRHQTQS